MSLLCPNCHSNPNGSGPPAKVVLHGSFQRRSDQKSIQRYRCRGCGNCFSDATESACVWQKKRHFNQRVMELLVSGVSQRRSAKILKLNRKTVVRKFLFLGRHAKELLPKLNSYFGKVQNMEFDDLETFEHSKLKPLSVPIAVEYKTRWILGFRVSSMAAKGKLAALARKKYGPRADHRTIKREELFSEIKEFIDPNAEIKSDQNPHYPASVKKHFPNAKHKTFKGRRGCVVGQGELKRGGFDPIFSLNHTCAMLRANINRLFRRTWCTTKLADRLEFHIALYALYHNLVLIKKRPMNSAQPLPLLLPTADWLPLAMLR